MPLVTCPECGKSFSDRASSCPECGFPISEIVEKSRHSIVTTERIMTPIEKDELYNHIAKCSKEGTVEAYEFCISSLKSLGDYKDSKEKILYYEQLIHKKKRAKRLILLIIIVIALVVIIRFVLPSNQETTIPSSNGSDFFVSEESTEDFSIYPNASRQSMVDGLQSAIEIKYTFTNNSGYDKCFNDFVIDTAYQGGIMLEAEYSSFFINGYSETNQDVKIRSGTTIEVICIYRLINDVTPVELELEELFGDKVLYNRLITVPEAPSEGMLYNDRWVSISSDY